jgi:hypothetical protein
MRRTIRLGTIIGWVWFGCVLAGALAVGTLVGVRDGPSFDVMTLPAVGITYAILGLLIVVRRPGNRVAWLLFVVATWVVLAGSTVLVLGDYSAPPDPPSIWDVLALVWDNGGYFMFLFVPIFLFFFLLPTGRFLTPRWAWTGCVGALLTCMASLDAVLQADIGPEAEDWTIPNPIGLMEASSPILQGATAAGLLLLVVGGILAIITRYRRADATVRSQIKWVVYGLAVMLVTFFGSWLVPESAPDWVSSLLFIVVLLAIPVSVVVAITRYRLYDIDRLVSRTVGYLIVVSLLGLVYVAGAVWVPSRLIGQQSPIFVAASTLSAAALFNPLRKRIIVLVDRRFNRSKYDAEQLVEHFGNVIGGQQDITGLVADTTSIVAEALQPSFVGFWVREDAKTAS